MTALRQAYGYDRVANVVTFGTEGSKQAIQTAARGLGIDHDKALSISALIPSDRGKTRTLHQCYYGDDEADFKPVLSFVRQMDMYPKLWEVAQKIEGLICRMGEHAGGVIFVDEPFTNSTALMVLPNGDIATQFDLHDSEKASLIKIDMLSIEALDKMHNCLDLLVEYGYIEKKATLKETYESCIGIYNLERTNPKMWEQIWEHKILSLFQMEQQSGIQGIALTKPKNLEDLATLNSVIRLMAQTKGAEQPLNKFARFKNDINLWYEEMDNYGLTKDEQKLLEPLLKGSYGICESQEKFMSIVQIPECGGFDLNWADKLRKAIAKKNPQAYDELTAQYYQNIKDKGLSYNLCHYVWSVLVATSRGYGFNASHTTAYSLVALQEMNLCFRYPSILWNCACLISETGGTEDKEEDKIVDIFEEEDNDEYDYIDSPDRKTKIKKQKGNDYKKLAIGLGKMSKEGIKIYPPDINCSNYTFTPNIKENKIVFGFRGIQGINDNVIQEIINNRPFSSFDDFLTRTNITRTPIIALIKAGAFDNFDDRKILLGYYIYLTCAKKKRLTLANVPTLIKEQLINFSTEEEKRSKSIFEFNRYLKTKLSNDKTNYILNERAIDFLNKIDYLNLVDNNLLNIKKWDKIYQKEMDVIRNLINVQGKQILEKLNAKIFYDDWIKYTQGKGLSHWEMDTLCYYYHEHELKKVDRTKYGITNFFEISENPVVDKHIVTKNSEYNLYKIYKIFGTCIAKNKDKGTVSLLTPEGLVVVKFAKEYFAIFDKQISEKDSKTGKKTVIEKSWFGRGQMIIVQGIRRGDEFVAKKYSSTAGHTLYHIDEITPNNEITLRTERFGKQ